MHHATRHIVLMKIKTTIQKVAYSMYSHHCSWKSSSSRSSRPRRQSPVSTVQWCRVVSGACEDGKTLVEDGSRLSWQRRDVSVVLVHPQIPQNCGNVARTCAATGVGLHLVGPMGFALDDKKLKRAGLDYWDWVAVQVHDNVDAFLSFYEGLEGDKRLFAYSKFGEVHYAQDGLYDRGTRNFLMFGAETTGLPEEAHTASTDVVQIPMGNYTHVRSLNLATSVGIGLFESLRQLDGTSALHTM